MSVVELSPSEVTEIKIIDPRVERSARIMDELSPGWADKINLEKFDIQNPFRCVLYYVYGKRFDRIRQESGYVRGLENLRAHGYNLLDLAFQGTEHNDDWRLEIQARKTR